MVLRLTYLVVQQDWSHCGDEGCCVTFWGHWVIVTVSLCHCVTGGLHCAVPGVGGLMQTWTVGGAGVRWDVGDTGRLEGYEGLRGETDTRGFIMALIRPG